MCIFIYCILLSCCTCYLNRCILGRSLSAPQILSKESASTVFRYKSYKGHLNFVSCVACSVLGDFLVSGGHDWLVIRWDINIDEQFGPPLQGHDGVVRSVAITPCGKYILSAGDDKLIFRWDLQSGTKLNEYAMHLDTIYALSIAENGDFFVSAGRDCLLIRWSMEDGNMIGETRNLGDEIRAVVISNDNTTIIAGCFDGTVSSLEYETCADINPKKISRFQCLNKEEKKNRHILTLAITKDGKSFITGSKTKELHRWDITTGELIGAPMTYKGAAYFTSLACTATTIIAGNDDSLISFWDIVTGDKIQEPLRGHSSIIRGIAIGPDGSIYSASNDNFIFRSFLENAGTGMGGVISGEHKGWVATCDFNKTGNVLVSACFKGIIVKWEWLNGIPLVKKIEAHQSRIRALAITENWIISGGEDTIIQRWDIDTMAPFGKQMQGHTCVIESIVVSEEFIISQSSKETIQWDMYSGALVNISSTVYKSAAPSKVKRILRSSKVIFPEDYLTVGHSSTSGLVCIGCNTGNIYLLPYTVLQTFARFYDSKNPSVRGNEKLLFYTLNTLPFRDVALFIATVCILLGEKNQHLRELIQQSPYSLAAIFFSSNYFFKIISETGYANCNTSFFLSLVANFINTMNRPGNMYYTYTFLVEADPFIAVLEKLTNYCPAVIKLFLNDISPPSICRNILPLLVQPPYIFSSLNKVHLDEKFSVVKDSSLTVTIFPFHLTVTTSRQLLEALVRSNDGHLFNSDFIRDFIQQKWKSYGNRKFKHEMYLYLFSLLCLVIWSILPAYNSNSVTVNSDNHAGEVVMCVCTIISFLYKSYYEVLHMLRTNVTRHFFIFWNALDFVQSVLGFASIVTFFSGDSSFDLLLALAVYLKWFGLLYYLRGFKNTGPLIRMIIEIVKNIKYFLLVLSIAVCAGANLFFVLLNNARVCLPGSDGNASTNDGCDTMPHKYGNPGEALFTVFKMLILNNFDDTNFLPSPYKITLQIVFSISMVFVPIILLNLLIALMGDSHGRILENTKSEIFLFKAQIILKEEIFMTSEEMADPGNFPTFMNSVIRSKLDNIDYLPSFTNTDLTATPNTISNVSCTCGDSKLTNLPDTAIEQKFKEIQQQFKEQNDILDKKIEDGISKILNRLSTTTALKGVSTV